MFKNSLCDFAPKIAALVESIPQQAYLLHPYTAPGRSRMQRVYASVDDDTLHRLDELAGAQKVHRSDVVGKAIESYLHLAGAEQSTQSSEADLQRPAQKILRLQKLLEVAQIRSHESL